MNELRDKVAVVTGAADGIGFALCERFAGEGMRVVMADIDEARLESASERVAADSGAEVLPVLADVSRWEDVDALATRATERFGGVHVLCNNAGVTLTGRTWKFSLEEWEWLLGINLWGVIHGIKAFVPGMIERGEPAHVVNTASIGGLLAFPVISMYTASKFAVVGLSESLRHDLQARGAPVGVSVLCPGATATSLLENSRLRRPGEARGKALAEDPADVQMPPAEVAAQAVDAIREDRFWILTHRGYDELIERHYRGILETGQVVLPDFI